MMLCGGAAARLRCVATLVLLLCEGAVLTLAASPIPNHHLTHTHTHTHTHTPYTHTTLNARRSPGSLLAMYRAPLLMTQGPPSAVRPGDVRALMEAQRRGRGRAGGGAVRTVVNYRMAPKAPAQQGLLLGRMG